MCFSLTPENLFVCFAAGAYGCAKAWHLLGPNTIKEQRKQVRFYANRDDPALIPEFADNLDTLLLMLESKYGQNWRAKLKKDDLEDIVACTMILLQQIAVANCEVELDRAVKEFVDTLDIRTKHEAIGNLLIAFTDNDKEKFQNLIKDQVEDGI